MYDLLIKHGEVLDPVSGTGRRLDIAITDGRIEDLAPALDEQSARRVLDVRGKVVSPGLIDLHCHVYEGVATEGVNENNVSPDLAGVRAGVTTVVDAGSAGCHVFGGFARHVVPNACTRVLAFLNVSRAGLLVGPALGERGAADIENTIRTVQMNRSLVRGIKLLLSGPVLEAFGLEAVHLAVRAARETGTPLMVHVGDLRTPPNPQAAHLTREMLSLLAPGDIVTHICTGKIGGVLDANGHVVPELVEARERGVMLDAAHGRTNLCFETTRCLLDQGMVPDSISSDLTIGGRTSIVYSLTECMTKFLAMGLTLAEVIRMTTVNPARALGLSDTLGTIAVGREADLSILEVIAGDWQLVDSAGHTLRGEQAIVPVATVRTGQVMMPDWGPHPWGWQPALSARPSGGGSRASH